MVAIHMPEAHFFLRRLRGRLLAAERAPDVVGAELAHVALDRDVAFLGDPVARAMGTA